MIVTRMRVGGDRGDDGMLILSVRSGWGGWRSVVVVQ